MNWLLYVLIFIFGYVTCKTFYFLKATRLSLVLTRASHIIYLSCMIKALESMAHGRGIALEQMLRTDKSASHISAFEYRYDEDVRQFKERSIDILRELHPDFFRKMIEFENWSEASKYLDGHRDIAFKFWEK